jgi:hypothetical protein
MVNGRILSEVDARFKYMRAIRQEWGEGERG